MLWKLLHGSGYRYGCYNQKVDHDSKVLDLLDPIHCTGSANVRRFKARKVCLRTLPWPTHSQLRNPIRRHRGRCNDDWVKNAVKALCTLFRQLYTIVGAMPVAGDGSNLIE